MTFSMYGKQRIAAILEHQRTVRGRKDPVSGSSITEHINLGWFVHIEFDGGTYAFSVGHERPNLEVGQIVNVRLWAP